MKKLTALLLSICLLTSCVQCFAGGVNVSLGTASGYTGDTIEIPVILSGNTGFASLGLEIGYDSSALELVGVTAEKNVGGSFTKAQDTFANPYNFGFDSAENITYNGTLAVVRFIIKAQSGEYPISISYYKGRSGEYTDGYDTNYDENFNSIGLSYTGGKVIVIKNQSFSVTDYSASQNLNFKVSVPESKGYIIAVVYDNSGKMIDMVRKPAQKNVEFSVSSNGKKLKVLWINNGLRPFGDFYEKSI